MDIKVRAVEIRKRGIESPKLIPCALALVACLHAGRGAGPNDAKSVQQCAESTAGFPRRQLTLEERTFIDKANSDRYFKAKKEGDELNLDALIAFGGFPYQVGKRFDAHGIAKGTLKAQLDSLLTLLDRGVDGNRPFSTMPLEVEPGAASAFGAAGVYKTGCFVVVSAMDGVLYDPVTKKTHIETVIVNDAYYDAIPALRAAYPDVVFVKATEAPAHFLAVAAGQANR